MQRLLHISDVHFGPPHRPPVADGVVAWVAEHRPDLVVVSGDLTQRAKPEQFRQARAFVDRLEAPALVVPGNHDVPLYRFWERLFDPFGAYRRAFSEQLEPVFETADLQVIGINSAHGWTLTEGRVSTQRLSHLRRQLDALPSLAARVVVLHHPLIPAPRFGGNGVVANVWHLADLLSAAGVDLVLTGHLHQAYAGTLESFYPAGRRAVPVFASGTTTSSRGRGAERGCNTCNWIEIETEEITCSHLLWNPQSRSFEVRSRHLYPRT